MNITIQPVETAQGRYWQVRLDQHCVSFRSEQEARQFVTTLQARIQAPHPLPGSHLKVAS